MVRATGKKSKSSLANQKIDNQENGDTVLIEEFELMRQQNVNLVKELDQYKLDFSTAIHERDQARRELLGERAFSAKLIRFINDIQKAAKANLNNLVMGSNYITDILNIANCVNNLNGTEKSIHLTDTNTNTNSPNRTQVANPMIAGHVILNPIINLRRVNEISSEEIRRLSNPHIQMNTSNLENNLNYNNTNKEPSPPTNSSQSASNPQHGGQNNILEFKFEEGSGRDLQNNFSQEPPGLNTIIELSQESSELTNNILEIPRPGCSRQALLSGVFHDVQMYVSSIPDIPQMMDAHNINTQRGCSTKSMKLTKSLDKSSKTSPHLSSLNKSCGRSNVLEENELELSNAIFNLTVSNLATPLLSSTRLNLSNNMENDPRPSTSFRPDDVEVTSTPFLQSESTIKRVTFSNINTRRGKQNVQQTAQETILENLPSPDSCLKSPEESVQKSQISESLSNTPTCSKYITSATPSSSSHSKVSTRTKPGCIASKIEEDVSRKGRKKAKCKPSIAVKRITRSKYRKQGKQVDSVFVTRKSLPSRDSEPRESGSQELKNNNKTKESLTASKSCSNASENQSPLINKPSTSKSELDVSGNLSNTLVGLSNATTATLTDATIKTNNDFSKISGQSANEYILSAKKNRRGKRKVQNLLNSNASISSPKKLRGAKVSLKEPSLRVKMRR